MRRVNYQTLSFRQYDQAKHCIPGPEEDSWSSKDNDELGIMWTSGEMMPQYLTDIVTSLVSLDDESEDEGLVE